MLVYWLTHSFIRQGRVVSPPKASRLMKLAHRPMIWPNSRPITATSSMAKNGSLWRFV